MSDRIIHHVHHADPNPATKKTEGKIERKTEIVHKKSSRGSPISVYQISGLALELSRQADGTIGPTFEANLLRAFECLTEYDQKLADFQSEQQPLPPGNNG